MRVNVHRSCTVFILEVIANNYVAYQFRRYFVDHLLPAINYLIQSKLIKIRTAQENECNQAPRVTGEFSFWSGSGRKYIFE